MGQFWSKKSDDNEEEDGAPPVEDWDDDPVPEEQEACASTPSVPSTASDPRSPSQCDRTPILVSTKSHAASETLLKQTLETNLMSKHSRDQVKPAQPRKKTALSCVQESMAGGSFQTEGDNGGGDAQPIHDGLLKTLEILNLDPEDDDDLESIPESQKETKEESENEEDE